MNSTSKYSNTKRTFQLNDITYSYFSLAALADNGLTSVRRLPYSVKVLLESLLRNMDEVRASDQDLFDLANWNANQPIVKEIPFMPGRVVLQDFTGVPCVVDLAAMRDAMKMLGGNPAKINPLVKCDLVIDHSVQVDAFAKASALQINSDMEFERNQERYKFLKWGQQSLSNFTCVPPATGIVHQVNLEYLAPGVLTKNHGSEVVVYPDSVVGTDSHTTMINGLGVLGWGVGGIEAEAVMLGQPIYMLTPQVIGFRLTGRLPEGTTATDMVLTVTEILRKHGVVDKFVEFFGEGIEALTIPDRATISNMAPEYGATCGFFPIDQVALEYLKFTGRSKETVALVEQYCQLQGLFWEPGVEEPIFTQVLELDLASVQPSLAGPKRPQDRVLLSNLSESFESSLSAPLGNAGFGLSNAAISKNHAIVHHPNGSQSELSNGAVVIAAITSCTNTSNPDVMLAAGLVARKANKLGLTRKPWVKTSLAPGSRVVTDYFDKAGLTNDLEALGFYTVGYGCTTCIGNSGPLPEEVDEAIKSGDLVVASVLSGNRNFEGRVHPSVKANYLASPPLCVVYAITGSVTIDVTSQPIGKDNSGNDVYLKDIWPTQKEILDIKKQCMTSEQFKSQYESVSSCNEVWNKVPVSKSDLYSWDANSSYIQSPPYFEGLAKKPAAIEKIKGARCLAYLGDSVTTDHISPAGNIAESSPAGTYLKSLGISKSDFNSYGSRRGNDRVMTRGTFANVRIKNKLAVDPENEKIREGGWTCDFSMNGGNKISSIYDAAMNYKKENTPLVVLAGKDYGMGSSRDWAAKGTLLLGCKAVICESFERIHRSNLVGMGVLPLCFKSGQSAQSLGLTGRETFDIDFQLSAEGLLEPRSDVQITASNDQGAEIRFLATCRIDTPVEAEYYMNGGVLQTVLRRLLNS